MVRKSCLPWRRPSNKHFVQRPVVLCTSMQHEVSSYNMYMYMRATTEHSPLGVSFYRCGVKLKTDSYLEFLRHTAFRISITSAEKYVDYKFYFLPGGYLSCSKNLVLVLKFPSCLHFRKLQSKLKSFLLHNLNAKDFLLNGSFGLTFSTGHI